MSNFEIIVYSKKDGSEPVVDFIYSLSSKLKAKLIQEVDLLADMGNELREPYSKHLEDGIFELRVKQGSDISRVLYFFMIGKKNNINKWICKKEPKNA